MIKLQAELMTWVIKDGEKREAFSRWRLPQINGIVGRRHLAPEHGDPAQSAVIVFFRTKDSTHTLSFKRGVVNTFTSAFGPFYRPEVSHLLPVTVWPEFFSLSLRVSGFAGASCLRQVLGENRPKMEENVAKICFYTIMSSTNSQRVGNQKQ